MARDEAPTGSRSAMNLRHTHEICAAFQAQAQWCWLQLGDAHRLGLAFNEETITETILLTLARQAIGWDIHIKSFTKREEGISYQGGKGTAADWEFRFEDASGLGITVRIQAKRLYLKHGRYVSLDGNGQQIRDLVARCNTEIPLYVFYNGPGPSVSKSSWRSDLPIWKRQAMATKCHWPFWRRAFWGCTISAPHHIPAKSGPRPRDLKWMAPWHVLVCNCHKTISQDGTLLRPDNLTASVPSLATIIAKNLERIHGFGNDQPEDVMRILKRRYNFNLNYQRPAWVTPISENNEEIELPEGVRGVVLIRDLRDQVQA